MSSTNERKLERCPVVTEESIRFLSLLYKINILRCIIKWIINLLTGTCELQRITRKCEGGIRTINIEQCLLRSKCPLLHQVIESEPNDVDVTIAEVMSLKRIKLQSNSSFVSVMKTCLEQIHGYDSLYHSVEDLRTMNFDSSNDEHENMLRKLWSLLQPDQVLQERISKQWGDIGFQGDDPQTDFRGMGMLGLENLLYFAENHTDKARQVLQHSHHPKYGYSYAVVGINITSMAYKFISSGLLRTHLYNNTVGRPQLKDFHQVYCYLFFEFDKFWMKSEPENVMAFGRIHNEFQLTIEAILTYAPRASLQFEDVNSE